jgi:hypothetical protein
MLELIVDIQYLCDGVCKYMLVNRAGEPPNGAGEPPNGAGEPLYGALYVNTQKKQRIS